MAETVDKNVGPHAGSGASVSAVRPNTATTLPSFKYYIHDRIASCRLQLIGDLTESEIPELDGCWRTAKTTLGSRKFILDLRALRSFDDAGRRWLSAMSAEGAECLPECFLRDALAGKTGVQLHSTKPVKLGLFARLVSLVRGVGVAAAD